MSVKVEKNQYFGFRKASVSIWDEFVYGGHLLALGDALAIASLSIVLGVQITWALPLVVYMSVLAINSYNRYEEYEQDILTNPERSEKMRKYIRLFPYLIALLLGVSAIVVLLTATIQALIFMGLLFVLGLLYTIIFKGWTKKIIGFKNFSIALPYSLMVIFLTLYYNHPVNTAVVLVLVFYYFRIFMSAMYFDIKDIEGDRKEGLKTFAVVIGRAKTINALLVLNILSFLPIIIGIYLRLIPLFAIGLVLTIPYTTYYVQKIRDNKIKKSFLYNVVADSEFLFWLPYILVGKLLL